MSKMTVRAQESIFWPGITGDIAKVRVKCRSCNKYAPTQHPVLEASSTIVQSPFEAIASDFDEFGGNNYLVTVNRFSNWQ